MPSCLKWPDQRTGVAQGELQGRYAVKGALCDPLEGDNRQVGPAFQRTRSQLESRAAIAADLCLRGSVG